MVRNVRSILAGEGDACENIAVLNTWSVFHDHLFGLKLEFISLYHDVNVLEDEPSMRLVEVASDNNVASGCIQHRTKFQWKGAKVP